MKHSLFGGGAAAIALFSLSLIFQPAASYAEPSFNLDSQQPVAHQAARDVDSIAPGTGETSDDLPASRASRVGSAEEVKDNVATSAQAQSFLATAYSLRGRTATGHSVRQGVIAADRRVLPLGTRVRLDAGSYSGEYTVLDTGGAVRGRKIDVWVPSAGEAMRFGRRRVKLTVLQYGNGGRRR